MAAPILQKVPAPALPQATQEYNRPFFDQFSNVLRLFFNRLTASFNALISPAIGDTPAGGSALYFPYGSFLTTLTQTASAINTPKRIAFDTTTAAVGMYFVVGDGIHVQQAGIYNAAFSIQLTNDNANSKDAAVWFRKNGTDVTWTDSVVSVIGTHGGQPGYMVLAANFFLELAAGDYIEMWWSTNNTDVTLNALPAITVPFAAPGAPAVALTLSFVSAV